MVDHWSRNSSDLSEHLTLTTLGMADAFNWIRSRLAPGAAARPAATPTMWSPCAAASPRSPHTEIELNAASGALGLPIGPREH
ncbi:hypothetical protein ACWDUL_24460 [Nocardia niigatensis]|uniref:hypothetical protein n=1 Tax=Nocardia niigatensis TaxID=209249 RepID=UPI0002FEB421|nr:hypothetical protein [Nocardia niigatensis]